MFRFAEDPYFRAFCHGISEGRYEPPSRKNISGRLLDENTARALEQKKKNIGSGEGFTLTSDGWEDVKGNSILNFVLTSASGLTISLKEFRAKKKKEKTGKYIAHLAMLVAKEVFPGELLNLLLAFVCDISSIGFLRI